MPKMKCVLIATAVVLTSSAEAACTVVKAETDLNGLRLGDKDSTERVLGKVETLCKTPMWFGRVRLVHDQSLRRP
jgi:hypothetical protein